MGLSTIVTTGRYVNRHCVKYARIWVFVFSRIRISENPYSRMFYVVRDMSVTTEQSTLSGEKIPGKSD